ncbi:MAG: alginate export family protein [Thermodesulfovibrionales bacterium]
MKNYLALLLGVVLVFGFAASAFAIHAEIPSETTAVVAPGGTQITIGGELRVRGIFANDADTFNSSIADHTSYYDERIRLAVDAKVTPNTEGYIQLESTNENPESASADLNIWGNYVPGGALVNGQTHATGLFQAGNATHDSLSVLQAWIMHSGTGLFGVPAGVKVGHMPLALGNGLFFDHTKFGDDALLFFIDPVQDLHLVALNAKFREGSTVDNDHTDGYVVLFNYAPKDFSISGDATYVDDQAAFGIGVNSENNPLHFWNFGLRGNGTVAGFSFKVDGELQAGSVKAINADGSDADFKGWAVMAGASYKLDPVTLFLNVDYGSGPKKNSDNIDAFVTTLGHDQHYSFVYEYLSVNACGDLSGGICNTWFVNLGGQADLTKDITGYINLYYIGAVEDNQITLPVSDLMTNGTSKNIGFEADAKVNYKIDRNLNYWVEGGYLFAGGFFDTPGHSADGAYAIRHGIQLTF